MKAPLIHIFLAAFFATSTAAFASSQAIFAADGKKATVLLMSMTSGDSDADHLYAALAVPEELINGKRTKRLEFESPAGTRAFSVVCVMSAFVVGNGTCTLIVHRSPNATIDHEELSARLSVQDPVELAKILTLFTPNPNGPLIYSTTDGHLVISVTASDGHIRSLEINYR